MLFSMSAPAAIKASNVAVWPLPSYPTSLRSFTLPSVPLEHRLLRGKGLGGSSAINGMVYVRGHPRDFDCWNEGWDGRGGWGAADVLPYFKKMEGVCENAKALGEALAGVMRRRGLGSRGKERLPPLYMAHQH